MRKKSEDLLRLLLRTQSRSAIFGLQAELRQLTRAELEKILDSLIAGAPERSEERKTPARALGDGGPASRVVHLLRCEAKLSDAAAIAELKRELGSVVTLPTEDEGLENWAKTICENTPAGEVVGAALTIAERAKAAEKEQRPSNRRSGKRRQ